jgi:anti-sigma28 factor (negative regulator of flagellin synthesis)
MKISDNGFSERIATPTTRPQSTVQSGSCSSSSSCSGSAGSSDNFQLSNIASRLQNAYSLDSSRASRVSQIAKAVSSNSFQIDPMQISKAMVSEAVATQAG